jgi:hypothetical protein
MLLVDMVVDAINTKNVAAHLLYLYTRLLFLSRERLTPRRGDCRGVYIPSLWQQESKKRLRHHFGDSPQNSLKNLRKRQSK